MNSPLLRLPSELRTKIWHYALGGITVYPNLKRLRYRKYGSTSTGLFKSNLGQLSLPRTCRQIYSEAALVFYHENTFAFHDYKAFKRFRDRIRDAHFAMIRSISVRTIDALLVFKKALMEADRSQASYQYSNNLKEEFLNYYDPMEQDLRWIIRLVIPGLLSTFPNLHKILIACSCHANGIRGKCSFDTRVSWPSFHREGVEVAFRE